MLEDFLEIRELLCDYHEAGRRFVCFCLLDTHFSELFGDKIANIARKSLRLSELSLHRFEHRLCSFSKFALECSFELLDPLLKQDHALRILRCRISRPEKICEDPEHCEKKADSKPFHSAIVSRCPVAIL